MRNILIIGLVAFVLYLLYKKQAPAPEPERIPFGGGTLNTTPVVIAGTLTPTNATDLINRFNNLQ